MILLFWLFLIPMMASFVAFLLPLSGKKQKYFAVLASLVPLFLLIYNHENWMGAQVKASWWAPLSVQFFLSVDGPSLLFIYLTAIIIPISLLATHSGTLKYPNMFYGLILLLEALLIGFFTARDLVLFTFFYEAMLLPLYFLINLWGGAERQMAALKFLVYMIAGSALMIAAVLALYLVTGSFDMDVLTSAAQNSPYAKWVLAAFLLAFAVKTPLFPFHAWLPDAYVQASTPGTILLSALLSKAGIYGIYRIAIGFFPHLMIQWNPILLGLAIAGVFYGALAAWRQNDFKRLIAYSSLSHVNFILVGLFIWNQTAQTGALLQAFNHGVTIAALFLVAGWLEERLGSTVIGKVSGLAKFLPSLCWLTLFFVLSSVALPGTNNFIGELLVLFGLFESNPWLAAVLGLTVVLSVVYMLRWMQKVYFEAPTFFQDSWIDIKGRELAIALPLILLILWIGIYPMPVLTQIATQFTS